MALSVLPLHYEHASDKGSAAGYLMQLIREGTEMDRYVVGESAVILLRNGGEDAVEAERLLDAIGAEYDRDPSQIFLHPEPLPLAGDLGAVAATRRASETMREESDPYALPWIVRRDGALHRFYANTVAFHIIMLRMRRSSPPFIEDVLRLLERNETADLLRFGDDAAAGRRFVAVALLKALALAAMAGYLKECFATIARVIERYVDEGRDPENLVVYQAAVVESLKSMKEYHRDEVLAFVEPYELAEGRYAFLSAVKTAATAREKMLSKSLFGDKIYHEGFTVRALRESFGAATKRVARAQSVDELFFIYTQELMRWLRDYEA
jgi:hypothetical protein